MESGEAWNKAAALGEAVNEGKEGGGISVFDVEIMSSGSHAFSRT